MSTNPIHLEPESATRIIKAAMNGANPLRLDVDGKLSEDEPRYHYDANKARERLNDMLVGAIETPDAHRTSLSKTARNILAFHGAKHEAVETMIAIGCGLTLEKGFNQEVGYFMTRPGDEADKAPALMEAHLNCGKLIWHKNMRCEMVYDEDCKLKDVPVTVRSAAVGRKLKEVLSHQALDDLPLIVAAFDDHMITIAHDPHFMR